ncbi:S1 family peptidase [Parasphingorhabdus sp.]|uniref:S1 family peptidase n=1 Tax=Parasphingorhabdus sp. TaxID=2709688 RepID=UPI003BAEDB8D
MTTGLSFTDEDLQRMYCSIAAVGDRGGTGMLLKASESSNRVLLFTNFHVLNGTNRARIMNVSQNFILPDGYLFEGSEVHDICVIDVSRNITDPVKIKLTINDIEFASEGITKAICAGWPMDDSEIRIGNPLTSNPKFLLGTIDQQRMEINSPPQKRFGMQTHIGLSRGHSGSPIWIKGSNNQAKIAGMYAFMAHRFNGGIDQRFSVHGIDLVDFAIRLLKSESP